MTTAAGPEELVNQQQPLIDSAREAIRVLPPDSRDRIIWLHELGVALRTRSIRTGTLHDLDEAVRVAQESIDTAPQDYPHLAVLLNSLAAHLGQRFSKTGSVADLEEAIKLTREAIRLTPPNDSRMATKLTTLATELHFRYIATGSIIDLEEAIEVAQEAVNASPQAGPERARRINILATVMHERYSRTGIERELENALLLSREIVDMTPADEEDRIAYLTNLGSRIGDRYLRTQDMADIDESIEIMRDAVRRTPLDHGEMHERLNILASLIQKRFFRTRDITDIREAIEMGHEVINKTPQGDPYRAKYGNNLADYHWNRYSATGCLDDFEKAVYYYESSLHHANSDMATRISAGKALFQSFADVSEWQTALEAANTTFSLLPKLAPRSLGYADRQRLLGRITGLSCDVAAVTLQAGGCAAAALSILEQGRGILASSIEQTRVSLLELQASHPELAEQFMQVRDELDAPIHYCDASVSQAKAVRRSEASQNFDNLLNEIRERPGFSDFLGAASENEMRAAARFGPIIVINPSRYRSDAILVEQHQIRSLALPDLTSDILDKREKEGYLRGYGTLEWLWKVAAGPILDALGLTGTPLDDYWPRVWWVPTGRLSKLPFHAAGNHYKGSTETVLDRVISSYSSSVQAIIHTRRRLSPSRPQTSPDRVILVSMSDTIGHTKLPFAAAEVSMLRDLCGSMNLDRLEPRRRKQDILEGLQGCKIFHFAGHAETDKDPAQSGLVLEDGTLTVAALLEKNLRECSPFLAYLSACGTGQTGGEHFFDESLHLISACQLAGFRHAIGTLREVNDESCMDVTRLTYESMGEEGFTDDSVCRGLHKAIRELRDRWMNASMGKGREPRQPQETINQGRNGELSRDIIPCEEDKKPGEELFWVPYVYFGV